MHFSNSLATTTDTDTQQEQARTIHGRVLIIDDDPTLGFLARQVLEKKYYAVDVASGAEHALQLLNTTTPDCILLDLTMPDIHGFEFCQLIKLSEKGHDIPIMVVSGKFDNVTVDRVFKLGAFDFVRKPVNWRILLNRLEFLMKYKCQEANLRDHQQQMASLYNCMPD